MDRREWVKGAMSMSIAAGLAGTGEAASADSRAAADPGVRGVDQGAEVVIADTGAR